MPQIDDISQAMQRHGATRATLVSDSAITLTVGKTPMNGAMMSAAQVQKFLDEIVPVALRGKMFQDGTFAFVHLSASGSLCVSVKRESPRFHVTIEPAPVLQPLVQPVIPPVAPVAPATSTVVIPPTAPAPYLPPPVPPQTYPPGVPPGVSAPTSSDPILGWQSRVMRQPIASWEGLWKAREHSLAQMLAIGGTILIFIGLSMPFFHVPIIGDLGWKETIAGVLTVAARENGATASAQNVGDYQATAKLIMGSAYGLTLISLVAAVSRWYEAAANCAESVGLGALVFFYIVKDGVEKALANSRAAGGGNPFTEGITNVLASQVYPTNAWLLVVVGTVVIMAASQIWKFSLPKRG
jgi:hypothetical protein